MCESNVAEADCRGAYQVRMLGAACSEVTCLEVLGACCEDIAGTCQLAPQAACIGPNRVWTPDATCADVACGPIPGACCNHANPDPLALEGVCTDGVIQSECPGDNLTRTKGGLCSVEPCDSVFQVISDGVGAGLVVLALLLRTGAKLYYGQRKINVA